MFRDEKDDRIFAVHRGPEQPGRIFRRAWNDDAQAGIMSEGGFIRLAMPETAAREIGTVGSVDDGRTFPIAKRTPPQRRDVCHQLIEARINEIDELHLKDGTLAVGGQTA